MSDNQLLRSLEIVRLVQTRCKLELFLRAENGNGKRGRDVLVEVARRARTREVVVSQSDSCGHVISSLDERNFSTRGLRVLRTGRSSRGRKKYKV